MTTDDKVNLCILIAVVLFCVWVFPAAIREAEDADQYFGIMQPFRVHR